MQLGDLKVVRFQSNWEKSTQVIKPLGASKIHQHRLVGAEWKTSSVTFKKHQGLSEEPFQSDDYTRLTDGHHSKAKGQGL